MKSWIVLIALLLPVVGLCSPAAVETPPAHQTFRLPSRHLHEPRVVNVYLPPGYSPLARGGYPTLYLLDGGVQEDFPHVARALDAAIRSGRVRPLLLVGIENTQRRRDLTGPTRVASDRAIAPQVGGSAAFRAFIADELIPAIASRYRVDASRGLMGESLAGLFVVETLFEQPALFDTYLALSPSLWWNDAALARRAKARMGASPALRGRLFVASANEDNIVPHVATLQRALRSKSPPGLYWTVKARPDLDHATIYRTLVPQLLVDYYGAVAAQDAGTALQPRRPVTE